jgi:hypothetical protein
MHNHAQHNPAPDGSNPDVALTDGQHEQRPRYISELDPKPLPDGIRHRAREDFLAGGIPDDQVDAWIDVHASRFYLDTREILAWYRTGLTPDQARAWLFDTVLEPHEAVQWAAAGYTPSQAGLVNDHILATECDAWRDLLPGDRACRYIQAGITTLTEAQELEGQRAAGVAVDDMVAALGALRARRT